MEKNQHCRLKNVQQTAWSLSMLFPITRKKLKMKNKNTSDAMNESGTVIKIIDKKAVVELNQQALDRNGKSGCDSCGAKILCVPSGNGKRIINAYNNLNAKVGNKVTVTQDDHIIFKISVYQYAIPLLGFLSGVFGLYSIDPNWWHIPGEIIMFFGGICGLIISGIIAKYLLSRLIEIKKIDTIFSIAKIIH